MVPAFALRTTVNMRGEIEKNEKKTGDKFQQMSDDGHLCVTNDKLSSDTVANNRD